MEFLTGRRAVLEALRAGSRVRRILLGEGLRGEIVADLRQAARAKGVLVTEAPRIELDRLTRTTRHQGVVAEVTPLETVTLERLLARPAQRRLLVLLDGITDPQNLGAIIRSAAVFGAQGVVIEEHRSAPLAEGAVRASAGAAEHLPVAAVKNLPRAIEQLKQANIWVFGGVASGGEDPGKLDWDLDLALVIGSEDQGLRRLVREKCDRLVQIPMQGKMASLNASVAAGILLYEATRGRIPSP
ncbi:MAG: 23S rRNA (guanosine(2251)-2'-O)-methyltransferase RlmB [Deinococcus sp.]|nr:23S rRNA (guanosine(2251)-2'-O)-methyltransferase RlmB [Deinococcus sp.]